MRVCVPLKRKADAVQSWVVDLTDLTPFTQTNSYALTPSKCLKLSEVYYDSENSEADSSRILELMIDSRAVRHRICDLKARRAVARE